MSADEKIKKYVIPPYQGIRTFYHSQKYFRYARRELINQLIRDNIKSVLDVGCGHALGANEIIDAGIDYVGIDPIEDNLKLAREDCPRGRFSIGFAQEIPCGDKSFDAVMNVTVWEILPTIADMEIAMREMVRVARRKIYSLDCDLSPRFMKERYMCVPQEYGLTFKRVNWNPEKRGADTLWVIDLGGIEDRPSKIPKS